jgi:hypothetical protein
MLKQYSAEIYDLLLAKCDTVRYSLESLILRLFHPELQHIGQFVGGPVQLCCVAGIGSPYHFIL